MYRPHRLLDLLCCPRTGGDLVLEILDDEAVLLSPEGVAYPILGGIVVTKPSSTVATRLCEDFLARHASRLGRMDALYDADLTRQALFRSGGEAEAWHLEEMDYWERHFAEKGNGGRRTLPGPNRTLPRALLLEKLSGGFPGGTILELGCGSSETLPEVYGPSLEHYIGLDLSFNACLLARGTVPGGLFLQGAVEELPVKRGVLDALVAYGVFHHLPGHEKHVAGLLDVLRPGGLLIGADPLGKPPVPRPFRKRTAGMSPHNDWIDWENLQRIIGGRAEVEACHYEYSPVRTLLVRLLYDGLGLRSPACTKLMMASDALWLATAGRLHRALGPAAVHYALRVTAAGVKKS